MSRKKEMTIPGAGKGGYYAVSYTHLVTFKSDAALEVTAGTALAGGTNATVDGTAHQKYLDKIESYSYNAMGVITTDETTKKLYAACLLYTSWDQKASERGEDKPVKQHDHAMDALRYFCYTIIRKPGSISILK